MKVIQMISSISILFSAKFFNEQTKQHGMTQKAVTETIRICKDRNVLREYLLDREKEVVTIMMSLFDEEQIMRTYAKDIEKETERKTAERMIKKGKMTLEEIADYIPTLSFAFCGAQRPQMRFRAAALRSKTATRLMQVISC
ncbi:hypothetical protein C818_02585 [Lachnospiraceae bacterium MD308]|nr:hypothetical protein C818_02585 [Lachnospiraceae bacterium MD308]